MKFSRPAKLVTSLLLAVFLLTSAGALLGYAWCVGDDGHVEVSYATGRDCCDDGQGQDSSEQYVVPTVSQASGDSCGLCLDFSAQRGEAVFFKRAKRTSMVSLAPLSANSSLPSALQSIKLVVVDFLPQPPLRIAQAILSLRTVVLLN